MKTKKAKSILRNCIHDLNEYKDYFTARPLKDFSRNGKILFNQIIESILCMGQVCCKMKCELYHMSATSPKAAKARE